MKEDVLLVNIMKTTNIIQVMEVSDGSILINSTTATNSFDALPTKNEFFFEQVWGI